MPTQRTLLDRLFRSHLLLALFAETSDYVSGRTARDNSSRGNNSAIEPVRFALQWLVVIGGCVSSGMALHFVEWLARWLWNYSHVLAWSVGLALVLGGPGALPPLTLCNGCGNVFHRMFWSAILIVIPFVLLDTGNTLRTKWAHKAFWTASALWHVRYGDVDFRRTCRFFTERGFPQSEEGLSQMNQALFLPYFRVGTGIGMLWASFGVFSVREFGIGMLIMALAIFLPSILLPRRGVHQNRSD